MKKKKNPKKFDLIEFIKSNVAGNIIFGTTYVSFFVFEYLFMMSSEIALLYATIIGNTFGNFMNFLVQKAWVFKASKKAPMTMQLGRYVLFMIVNAGIFYAIIIGLERGLGLTPYLGQFVAGWFFFVWNYFWLKLWVFQKVGNHGSGPTKQKTA